MKMRITLLMLSFAASVSTAQPQLASVHQPQQFVTGYLGFATTNTFSEAVYPQNIHFTDGHQIGLGYGKELKRGKHWAIEAEGIANIHVQSGDVFPEANVLLLARWHTFPWDKWVDTSMAVGEGLSLASQVPPLEERLHGSKGDETAAFLNYLAVEVEAKLFQTQRNETIHGLVRIHHRSGVGGLFSGVDSGSNLITTGLRYRF